MVPWRGSEAHSLMDMVPEDVEIAQIENTVHLNKLECRGKVHLFQ